MSDPAGGPDGPHENWREQRREERRARRDERHEMTWGLGGSWIWGVILVALGIVFLLENFGIKVPQNWWAVFLVLPGIGVLWSAWRMYQHDGRLTRSIVSTTVVGGVLVLFGLSFLAGIDWGVLWPLVLIVLGLGIVAGGYFRRS